MEVAIEEIQTEINDAAEEIAFIKNFERPFLDSEWAEYYLWHENGVVYDGERVIRLRNRERILADTQDDILSLQAKDDKDVIVISSPQESWYYFIYDKLEPLKDLWFIE